MTELTTRPERQVRTGSLEDLRRVVELEVPDVMNQAEFRRFLIDNRVSEALGLAIYKNQDINSPKDNVFGVSIYPESYEQALPFGIFAYIETKARYSDSPVISPDSMDRPHLLISGQRRNEGDSDFSYELFLPILAIGSPSRSRFYNLEPRAKLFAAYKKPNWKNEATTHSPPRTKGGQTIYAAAFKDARKDLYSVIVERSRQSTGRKLGNTAKNG